jgi:hypothetical protein
VSAEQIGFAVVSLVISLVSLGLGGMNAWSRVQMKNEILQMRVYVSDHYISTEAFDKCLQRLERLIEKLEQKIADGNRRA